MVREGCVSLTQAAFPVLPSLFIVMESGSIPSTLRKRGSMEWDLKKMPLDVILESIVEKSPPNSTYYVHLCGVEIKLLAERMKVNFVADGITCVTQENMTFNELEHFVKLFPFKHGWCRCN